MIRQNLSLRETAAPIVWENEHRLIHALDLVPFGLVMLDRLGRIQHINGLAKSYLPSCGQNLMPGKPLVDAVLEAVRKDDWVVDTERLANWLERTKLPRARPLIVGLRSERWLQLTAKPSCEDGLVITLNEITDFRQREVLLAEKHDRLAGEGEDLKVVAKHLNEARARTTEALREAELANEALQREIGERRALEQELRRMAHTDALTGVLNRRRFIELLELEVERSKRYHRPLALLMLDLDHFKRINDRFGHAAGDEALRHFARVCADNLRDIDLFARLGGEEFAAVLPETTHGAALQVAQRLRLAASDLEFSYGFSVLQLTVSIGAASMEAADFASSALLSRADRALYAAKTMGRNRVAHMANASSEPCVDNSVTAV